MTKRIRRETIKGPWAQAFLLRLSMSLQGRRSFLLALFPTTNQRKPFKGKEEQRREEQNRDDSIKRSLYTTFASFNGVSMASFVSFDSFVN